MRPRLVHQIKGHEQLAAGIQSMMVARFLFWGVVVAGALMAAMNRYLRETIRRYSLHLLIAIVVTLVWRYPKGGTFFLGMEYEDADVYTVAARQILDQSHTEGAETYLTTVCEVGSILACQSSAAYSGHYIGSPYVLSVASKVFGYRPTIAPLVGIGASCITVLLVFFIARIISGDELVPICSAAVFAMTPVFAVYGIAAFAEPISNMYAAISFLAYLSYLYAKPTERTRVADIAALCTWSLALLFAILVKRENLVLAFALPFVSAARIAWRCDPATTWYRAGAVAMGSGVAVAFSLSSLRFSEVVLNETVEFHRTPFGLEQVRGLLPAFLSSFGVTSWYCLGGVWGLVGILLVRRRDSGALYPALVIIAYLTLYVSHVRSYYQVNYGEVVPGDALRYSMNFMTMWSLLAGIGLAYVIRKCRGVGEVWRWRAVCVTAALIIYGATAYRYTKDLRDNVTREERHTRIEPAVVASRLAIKLGSADTYVVTLEPLVLQMYGPPDANVIELSRVSEQLNATLVSQHSHLNLLYIDNALHRNVIDRHRYQAQMDLLDHLMGGWLYRDAQFDVVTLNTPTR